MSKPERYLVRYTHFGKGHVVIVTAKSKAQAEQFAEIKVPEGAVIESVRKIVSR